MEKFSSYFMEDNNVTHPFDINAQCTEIHNVNSSLQCMFAMVVEDCVEIIEYLDYNNYVFCTFGLKQIWAPVVFLAVWLLVLFISLGVTSNYFLCPALFTISNHLGLSQNVAGVTLLAFGNAAPDIFSSVAGLQKASTELAIASLIGAGVFVTSVVAGSVFLTKSFTLMIRPFLRDNTFYLVAVTWTFALFFTNKSYLYHGIGFVALYFVYIFVVIGSRYIYVKRQKKKRETEDNAKKNIENGNDDTALKVNGKEYDDDEESTAVVLKAFYFGGFEWIEGGGRRLSRSHMFPDARRLSSKVSAFTIDNNQLGSCQSIQNGDMSSTEKLNPDLKEDRGELWDFMIKVCPINIRKWPNLVWYKKCLALFKSPSILIMRLTVPVLDTSEEDLNWNRYLICTQCITGPLFISFVCEYAFYMIGDVFPFVVLLICASVCCAILVYCTSGRENPPSYHWVFSYLGFGVAVTWIYCLANEIVALLQIFGVIFNLSDAILGLTILSWGNSLSDLLSNIAVARKDYPRMAISACFGGPLLALLLGLGIPCIIEIVKGRCPPKYSLTFTAQFAFLFITIGTILITTTLLMTIWKFKTRRCYGVFLILIYFTFVFLSILDELKVF